jgi:hypothetical protein
MRLPGRGSFPRVDDHLVEPEVTRDEIIGGRRVVAMPAHPPHADRQSTVDRVVGSCVASGYTAAAVCVRRAGIDPETGARYLEEIAEQNVGDVTEKASADHSPTAALLEDSAVLCSDYAVKEEKMR